MRRIQAGVTCRVAEAETPEVRRFLAREWPLADRRLFGEDLDWTSRPVVVEALAGRELVGVALGEAVAGMARLHDVLVADAHRGRGLGSRLVELFCVRAARLGAARCFLRCPDTDRHRGFYERLGFVLVARLPRYYHGRDFLEYLREPLVPQPAGSARAIDAATPQVVRSSRSPMPDQPATPSAGEFGAAFKSFLEQSVSQAPAPEPVFAARLRAHLGADPATLPTVSDTHQVTDQPNLQLALDDWLRGAGRSFEALGVASEYKRIGGLGLADLLAPGGGLLRTGPAAGPVEWTTVHLDGDRTVTCLQFGLLLVTDGDDRFAILVRGPTGYGVDPSVQVEAMATDRERARRLLAGLRAGMAERNVYRGRVISLLAHRYGPPSVRFHELPPVGRDDIVLPEGLLERLERHTLEFSRHRERLLAAGRHLRRGILLHGRPGTGKTLTATYLAGRMDDRTVVLVTGREVGMLRRSCELARLLAPSMVVLEDVDLIAEERTGQSPGQTTLLFELLNEMDGLPGDADVVVLLTSNRPERLEPALVARPGRVDLAVEVPLPDAAARRRLFELYGRGLVLRVGDLDGLVGRTEGVSPAFIRELLRKAALLAVGPGEEIVVEDQHLDQALHELVVGGGELTGRLLGG
jgi:ribosomal protein S18 acetylase RimI-like enzyme